MINKKVGIVALSLMIFQNIGYATEKPIDSFTGAVLYSPFCGDSRFNEYGDGGINIKFGEEARFEINLQKFANECIAKEVASGENYTCQELYNRKADIWWFIRGNTVVEGSFNYKAELNAKEKELTCKEGVKKLDEDLEVLAKSSIAMTRFIEDFKEDYIRREIGVEYFTKVDKTKLINKTRSEKND